MKKILILALVATFLISAFLPALKVHAVAHTLTVVSDTGRGTVTASGINCGGDCSEDIEEGTTVTLTMTPHSGWTMTAALNSSCGRTASTQAINCTVTINGPTTVYMGWTYANFNVTAATEGTGSGSVGGTGTYAYGTNVALTAHPGADSVFSGWQTSGDICFGAGGKGSDNSVNTSPSCSTVATSGTLQTLRAVARFDKATASSSGGAPQTNSGTSRTPTPTPGSTATTTEKPSIPSLDSVVIEGESQKPTEVISISSDKPLLLKGKTIPNGKVTLYVFSEPKKYTFQADTNGDWSYAVTGLPAGKHHAEIEVTDPTTNQVSERKKLLEFTVIAAKQTAKQTPTQASQSNKNSWIWWTVGGVVVLGGGAAGYFVWRHKHSKTGNDTPTSFGSHAK